MAQEMRPQRTLEVTEDRISDRTPSESAAADQSLSRSISSSRLNARAPEFVPRVAPAQVSSTNRVKIHHHHHHQLPHHHPHQPGPVVHVVYHHPPPPPPPPASPPYAMYHPHPDYYGGGIGEQEADLDQASAPQPQRDGLSEEVIQKITKQVEYYFSDANLATTEHLMRFITKDPEGYVPITVIASFKKIKALIHNNSFLADALRTSSKLVVSEDGKRVRRQQPFTESDVEELQSRIVVAENLPDDHCYQSLMKVFSVAGSVKTIRTCYPQASNGTSSATNRSSKMDMLFANKLHAFVEYETVENAEKAVAELNDGRNWRSGLRVRLLSTCMVSPKQGAGRGKKSGNEGDANVEEEDVFTSELQKVKHIEQDPSQSAETTNENFAEEVPNDKESGPAKRGKGRGRGGAKGRGRGHYHTINNSTNNHHRGGNHAIGTPPSSHPIHGEVTGPSKQPPRPRMPDGTRGFTMGRGKPLPPPSSTI